MQKKKGRQRKWLVIKLGIVSVSYFSFKKACSLSKVVGRHKTTTHSETRKGKKIHLKGGVWSDGGGATCSTPHGRNNWNVIEKS